MRRSTLHYLLILLISFIANTAPAAPGQCTAASSHTPVQLVELYTSEGCSSCPPADRWLAQLPASKQVMPLAFHVDYWNYLGWRDRFSDARFTHRQQQIGRYNRQATIYTPEVVVNGKELRRWPDGLPAPSEEQDPRWQFQLQVRVTDRQLNAQLSSEQPWPTQRHQPHIYAAITESHLQTAVGRGENRGRTLQHQHVVRAYSGPQQSDEAIALALPETLNYQHAALVVWLEAAQTGKMLQAVRLPLSHCGASG